MPTFADLTRSDSLVQSVNRDAVVFIGPADMTNTASYVMTWPFQTDGSQHIAMSPAAALAAVNRHLVALPLADTGDETEAPWQKAGTIYVKPEAVYHLIPVAADKTDLYVGGWGRAHVGLSLADLKAALA